MVDDLTTRGVTEPYRMFTSRAEYRLALREDNADVRLTPIGRELGLVDAMRWRAFQAKQAAVEAEQQRLAAWRIRPHSAEALALEPMLGRSLEREASALDLLRRPEVSHHALVTALQGFTQSPVAVDVAEQVEVAVKYAGYIARQQDEVERERRYEDSALPADFDYASVSGLSREVEQKLSRARPATLGQAGRISGVTPAAIALLLVHLRRRGVLPGAHPSADHGDQGEHAA